MTGKLRPEEMLRRLDLIAERRAQARERRREKATRRVDDRVPRRADVTGAPDRSG